MTSCCAFWMCTDGGDKSQRTIAAMLSCCDQDGDWLASSFRPQVDLGAEPSLASSQRFIRIGRHDPLFCPPAACCGWARIMVPSTWCRLQSNLPAWSACC
jgi:hypothetical protein